MAKKTSQQSKDALVLGALFVLSFLVLQIVNVLAVSIKAYAIDLELLQTKMIAQSAAFLVTYFITLMYIKHRTK